VTPRFVSASPSDQGGLYAPFDRGGVLATRSFDVALFDLRLGPDPATVAALFDPGRIPTPLSQGAARRNYTGIDDEPLASLPERAQASLDFASRQRGYVRVQREVNTLLPYIVLYERPQIVVDDGHVGNLWPALTRNGAMSADVWRRFRARRGAVAALYTLVIIVALSQPLLDIQSADDVALFTALVPSFIPHGLVAQTPTYDSFYDQTRGYAPQDRVRQAYANQQGRVALTLIETLPDSAWDVTPPRGRAHSVARQGQRLLEWARAGSAPTLVRVEGDGTAALVSSRTLPLRILEQIAAGLR